MCIPVNQAPPEKQGKRGKKGRRAFVKFRSTCSFRLIYQMYPYYIRHIVVCMENDNIDLSLLDTLFCRFDANVKSVNSRSVKNKNNALFMQ